MRLLPSGVIWGGSPLWAPIATRSFPCASPRCPAAGGHTPEAEKGLRKGPQDVVLSSGPRGQAWGASRRTDRPAGQTWAPGRRETRRRGPSPGPPLEAWTAAEGAGRERRVSSTSEDALCWELVLGGRRGAGGIPPSPGRPPRSWPRPLGPRASCSPSPGSGPPLAWPSRD